MGIALLLVTVLVGVAATPLTVPISERSKTAEFTNGSSLLRSMLDASSGENAVHYLDSPGNYQVNNDTTGGLDEELGRVLDGFVFLNNLYDALVRPGQFDQPGPTTVEIGVTVHPGLQVNEERNELTATLTLYQSWVDRRLAYQSRVKHPERLPSVTLAGSMHQLEPWLPDTFVMNEKRTVHHDFIGGSELIRIFPLGSVEREQRITTTVHCPFFRNDRFPFDTHVCHINLTSFSWNRKQVEYKLRNGTECNDFNGQAGPFALDHCTQSVVTFPREELLLGESSGLIYSVVLKRNLSHYSSKVFAPLALFTLVAVVGLGLGPQIGAALSYFMFGVMSIFMGVLLRDQSSWAYGRTALDSYFVYSLVTVILSGLLNLLKKRVPPSGEPTTESYEMHLHHHHHQETAGTSRRNGSARNGNVRVQNHQRTHFATTSTRECDQMLDDDFSEAGHQGMSFCFRVRAVLGSVSQVCGAVCSRINDFSAWFMLSVFISWNVLYWICYVHQ